jgi:hypothetical protein
LLVLAQIIISRMDFTLQKYRLGDIATRAMKLEECITIV